MAIQPSHRTAAIAGAWAALGFVSYDAWDKAHPTTHNFLRSSLFLLMIVVFFLVPFIYFVLGRGSAPFSHTWFLDPVQRARYGVIAKRMFTWFVGALVAGMVWSVLLPLIWPM
jgi:hypothetical protein